MYYFIFLLLLFFLCWFSGYHIIVYLIDKTAHFLAYIFVNVDSSRRRIAKYNIKLVFPEYSESKVNNILFKSTKITVINLISGILGRLLYLTDHYHSIDVNIPDQMLKDIDKNGIILVGSHFGLFLDIRYLGFFTNKKITVIHKSLKILTPFICPNNCFNNIKYYQMKKGFSIFEQISNIKKEVVMLACDQKSHNGKQKINFLNQLVSFHYGPAVLSLKNNKSVWSCKNLYDLENKKSYWTFTDITNKCQNNTDFDLTQKIADILTQDILEHPEQYFWLHDRFNYRNR